MPSYLYDGIAIYCLWNSNRAFNSILIYSHLIQRAIKITNLTDLRILIKNSKDHIPAFCSLGSKIRALKTFQNRTKILPIVCCLIVSLTAYWYIKCGISFVSEDIFQNIYGSLSLNSNRSQATAIIESIFANGSHAVGDGY